MKQHAPRLARTIDGIADHRRSQAGRRMAEMVAGKGAGLDLPIFTSPLPSHGLLTPFRRLGQAGMYRWYYLKDEIH